MSTYPDLPSKANGHKTHSKQQLVHSRSLPDLYAAIYFGDSEVNAGDPFAITCRISIDEPVQWIKDGHVLTATTHRHGHVTNDDFVFSELEDEGAVVIWIHYIGFIFLLKLRCVDVVLF